MIFFIYTATEEVPFEGLFEPIGSYKKIFLSNNDKQIKLFNQYNGSIIEDLLPEGIIDPTDETICYIPPEDDRIFFIPLEMKDTLKKLIKGLFKSIVLMENKTSNKPSKDDIGLVSNSELSQFYEKIETQTVIKPIVEDTVEKTEAKKELLTLLNKIAAEDNEIDAVLVSTYDGNRTRVAYSSDPKEDRRVDTEAFAAQLKDLVSLLTKTKQVNPNVGLFDHVMFQYAAHGDSPGSLIDISHLPQYGENTFIIFVSATAEGIEMLELYRKRNLPNIQTLLNVLIGH